MKKQEDKQMTGVHASGKVAQARHGVIEEKGNVVKANVCVCVCVCVYHFLGVDKLQKKKKKENIAIQNQPMNTEPPHL